MPNLLLILDACSNLESDMTLSIDGGVLLTEAKSLKVTGLPFLLVKLREYGFKISDFGKAPKAGNAISVSFIDNRYLTAALKSICEAILEMNKGTLKNPKNNDYFYMLHYGLLENEFEKDGISYNKCHCGSFVFRNLTNDIVAYCKDLLDNELSFTL